MKSTRNSALALPRSRCQPGPTKRRVKLKTPAPRRAGFKSPDVVHRQVAVSGVCVCQAYDLTSVSRGLLTCKEGV